VFYIISEAEQPHLTHAFT